MLAAGRSRWDRRTTSTHARCNHQSGNSQILVGLRGRPAPRHPNLARRNQLGPREVGRVDATGQGRHVGQRRTDRPSRRAVSGLGSCVRARRAPALFSAVVERGDPHYDLGPPMLPSTWQGPTRTLAGRPSGQRALRPKQRPAPDLGVVAGRGRQAETARQDAERQHRQMTPSAGEPANAGRDRNLRMEVTTQPDLGRPLAGRCVSGLGSRHDPSTIVPPRPA